MKAGGPERESNNEQVWQRLETVLDSFYRSLQQFSDVDSQDTYKFNEESYRVCPKGNQSTQFGEIEKVHLLRLALSSPRPWGITLGFQSEPKTVLFVAYNWRMTKETGGLDYSLIGGKEGKITKVAQIFRQKGYFDSEKVDLNQYCCYNFYYDTGNLRCFVLQLGYEGGSSGSQAYIRGREDSLDPIKLNGKTFAAPTLEQAIDALENILSNEKALVLEEVKQFESTS